MYGFNVLNAIYGYFGHFLCCIIFCCQQEERRSEALDLSRGWEGVPILVDETCTPSAVSPLDTCYTYARNPLLHESVTLEQIASTCYVHMFSLCTSGSNCLDTGGVHSSWKNNG